MKWEVLHLAQAMEANVANESNLLAAPSTKRHAIGHFFEFAFLKKNKNLLNKIGFYASFGQDVMHVGYEFLRGNANFVRWMWLECDKNGHHTGLARIIIEAKEVAEILIKKDGTA